MLCLRKRVCPELLGHLLFFGCFFFFFFPMASTLSPFGGKKGFVLLGTALVPGKESGQWTTVFPLGRGQEPDLRSFEVTSFYSIYGVSSNLARIAAHLCFFL